MITKYLSLFVSNEVLNIIDDRLAELADITIVLNQKQHLVSFNGVEADLMGSPLLNKITHPKKFPNQSDDRLPCIIITLPTIY